MTYYEPLPNQKTESRSIRFTKAEDEFLCSLPYPDVSTAVRAIVGDAMQKSGNLERLKQSLATKTADAIELAQKIAVMEAVEAALNQKANEIAYYRDLGRLAHQKAMDVVYGPYADRIKKSFANSPPEKWKELTEKISKEVAGILREEADPFIGKDYLEK